MLHAQFDGAVPFQCAIDTVAASRASGADSETILYYGEGTHAIDLYRKYQTAVDARWTQFLIREMNLGNQVAAGSKVQIHGTPNRSAVISLTATQSVGGGFLQALSCSATPGSTSNLNTDAAGQTRAGLAIVHFDATGTACIYTSFQTHLVVDLQGYLADTAFNDVTDSRLLDTRNGARPLAGSSSQIHGTPDTSAVISLVSTQGRGGGWLQALPCGTTPGSTSNLNTDEAGQTRAGLAIVRFDATGTACIYTSAGAHIVVDLQGYLAPTAFDDIADVRLVDTRTGVRVAANSKTVIRGTANRSAFVSLVSTQAVGGGWLQVLPCSATPGSTSNLNADQANLTIAGAAVAQFDTNGEACVYSSVSTHLVVDLQGYFTTGSFDDIADVRLLDTRMS